MTIMKICSLLNLTKSFVKWSSKKKINNNKVTLAFTSIYRCNWHNEPHQCGYIGLRDM